MARMCNTNETSTLMYQLVDESLLAFNDFNLIVRSLHSYRVNKITPQPDSLSMVVELGYVCSLKNVASKLGSLPVTVTKLNQNVGLDELDHLAALKRQFNFGTSETEEGETSKPAKKRKYKESR
nr:NS3 [Densovirinae sp.]WGZ60561.1 NS3 [Densovirinae sp.]